MIKLQDRDDKPFETGREAMRQILLRRADRSIFETDDEVNRLVDYSGGHPRELLRLLKLCCEVAESKIDSSAVSKAVELLGSDYRRFLEPEDYSILATADRDNVHLGNDERTRKLMYNLALLEYIDGSCRRCQLRVGDTVDSFGNGYRGGRACLWRRSLVWRRDWRQAHRGV
jgi:thiamine monophosphate kinase